MKRNKKHDDSGVLQIKVDNEFWKIYYPRIGETMASQFYKEVRGSFILQFFLHLPVDEIVIFFLRESNTQMATSLIKAYITGYKNRGYLADINDARFQGDY